MVNKDKFLKHGPVVIMFLCTGIAFYLAETYAGSAAWTEIKVEKVSAGQEKNNAFESETVIQTVAETEQSEDMAVAEEEKVKFYLAEIGPEGTEESYAEILLEELSRKDAAWFEEIIRQSKYGDGGSAKVKVSSVTYTDGDGAAQTAVSNVDEILAMASVLCEEAQTTDYNAIRTYVNELWNVSHKYEVVQSDVYYCTECSEDENLGSDLVDEAGGEEFSENLRDSEEADEERTGEVKNGDAEAGETEADGAETDEAKAGEVKADGGEVGETGAIIEGSGANAGPGANLGPSAGEEEKVEGPTAAPKPWEIYGPGISVSTDSNALETASEGPAGEKEEAPAGGPANVYEEESAAMDEDTSAGGSAGVNEDTSADDSANGETGDSAAVKSGESVSEDSGADENVKDNKTATPETTGKKQDDWECPGHVDVSVLASIVTLEGSRNLFTLDETGNYGAQENFWTGWTEENIKKVIEMEALNLYEEYGVRGTIKTVKTPLTNAEIETYMEFLSDEISEERKKVIRFALESVGRVPYYWGGKPSGAGYANGRFTKTGEPDSNGRTTMGLDCSGWINWVYWSATGERLPFEGTDGLCSLGTASTISELLPGDLAIRTGEDSHVVIYLGMTADGKRLCIHESSYAGTVAVSEMSADWGYYRNLLN